MVMLGILNSKVAEKLLAVINPTLNYTNEAVGNVPIYCLPDKKKQFIDLVEHAVSVMKHDWDLSEISWDFKMHYLISRGELKKIYQTWMEWCDSQYADLYATEQEINNIIIESFELDDVENYVIDNRDICTRRANKRKDIVSLISYSVGCMLGRFNPKREGIITSIQDASDVFFDKDGIIPITDEEYIILCNAVANEAGSDWISVYDKARVVEVIMNRVHSSLFPNTIYGVLAQPFQFEGSYSR